MNTADAIKKLEKLGIKTYPRNGKFVVFYPHGDGYIYTAQELVKYARIAKYWKSEKRDCLFAAKYNRKIRHKNKIQDRLEAEIDSPTIMEQEEGFLFGR